MSTKKPRITVTLEPHSHEILSRLSTAGGQSMSQIVAGFVELAIPSLERVVLVMERAKAAPEEARAGLASAFARAEQSMLAVLKQATDANEELFDAALSVDGDGAGRACEADPGPSELGEDPRACNTGVRSVKSATSGACDGGEDGPL